MTCAACFVFPQLAPLLLANSTNSSATSNAAAAPPILAPAFTPPLRAKPLTLAGGSAGGGIDGGCGGGGGVGEAGGDGGDDGGWHEGNAFHELGSTGSAQVGHDA